MITGFTVYLRRDTATPKATSARLQRSPFVSTVPEDIGPVATSIDAPGYVTLTATGLNETAQGGSYPGDRALTAVVEALRLQ